MLRSFRGGSIKYEPDLVKMFASVSQAATTVEFLYGEGDSAGQYQQLFSTIPLSE